MKTSFLSVITLIVISTIFLASCGKVPEKDSQTPVQNTGTTAQAPGFLMPEQNTPTVDESIATIGTKLKSEPIYRACIAQSIQMCGSQAVSQITQGKDDDTACDIFEDPSLKESCINAINTELARKTLNITLCDKVSSASKAGCIQQIVVTKAIQTKDIKVCATLKSPKLDSTTTSTNIPLPIMDNASEESQCVMQVIMTLDANDETLKSCDTLENKLMRNECTQSVRSRIEMNKNMPKLPVDIPNLPQDMSAVQSFK